MFKAASYAKTTEVSLSNVNDVVNKATSMVADTQLVNFDKDMGFDFFNPESHKSVKSNKIPFTWEYWNKISKGGLDHKTLHCYIGGNNVGKCCEYSTIIKVRNKRTGEIKEISIGDFFNMSLL